jgi:hypothetical protein
MTLAAHAGRVVFPILILSLLFSCMPSCVRTSVLVSIVLLCVKLRIQFLLSPYTIPRSTPSPTPPQYTSSPLLWPLKRCHRWISRGLVCQWRQIDTNLLFYSGRYRPNAQSSYRAERGGWGQAGRHGTSQTLKVNLGTSSYSCCLFASDSLASNRRPCWVCPCLHRDVRPLQ